MVGGGDGGDDESDGGEEGGEKGHASRSASSGHGKNMRTCARLPVLEAEICSAWLATVRKAVYLSNEALLSTKFNLSQCVLEDRANTFFW